MEMLRSPARRSIASLAIAGAVAKHAPLRQTAASVPMRRLRINYSLPTTKRRCRRQYQIRAKRPGWMPREAAPLGRLDETPGSRFRPIYSCCSYKMARDWLWGWHGSRVRVLRGRVATRFRDRPRSLGAPSAPPSFSQRSRSDRRFPIASTIVHLTLVGFHVALADGHIVFDEIGL